MTSVGKVDPPKVPAPDELRPLRLEYLRDCYSLCAGHINTMFNYYMIAAALAANAYIQALNPELQLPRSVPFWIAMAGLALSLIFFLVHMRSRMMIDTVETLLEVEEVSLFPYGGPLKILPKPVIWRRHKFLVPAAYTVFLGGFVLMSLFALGLPDVVPASS